MKCSIGISNFLEEISSLSLLFSYISLHCSLKKSFLSLLAIFWNSIFKWVYLSLSPSPSGLLFFSQLFLRPPQTTPLPSCISFSFVLITTSCKMLWTSVQSPLGTLSTRSNPLNLFLTSIVSTPVQVIWASSGKWAKNCNRRIWWNYTLISE